MECKENDPKTREKKKWQEVTKGDEQDTKTEAECEWKREKSHGNEGSWFEAYSQRTEEKQNASVESPWLTSAELLIKQNTEPLAAQLMLQTTEPKQ